MQLNLFTLPFKLQRDDPICKTLSLYHTQLCSYHRVGNVGNKTLVNLKNYTSICQDFTLRNFVNHIKRLHMAQKLWYLKRYWYSHVCRLAPHLQQGYSVYKSLLVISTKHKFYQKFICIWASGHLHLHIQLFNVLNLQVDLRKYLNQLYARTYLTIQLIRDFLVYCVNSPNYFLPTALFVYLPKFSTTNNSHCMVAICNTAVC